MLVKKEKEQENHVVAIKNKLYDNSALEESTQRSSMNEQFMSNSMYQNGEGQFSQEQLYPPPGRFRTDSAAKPFGIKKPGAGTRGFGGGGSVYTAENRSYMLPSLGQAEPFSQNYKSYRGLAPQSAHHSTNANIDPRYQS